MATVEQPSPGLYAAVLHALGSTDPRTRTLASTMTALVDHLTIAQAKCLPEAIGGVLPLLQGDVERLHFAAEIAARLDLFEVASTVAGIAITTNDPELLLVAATLCGNPAADRAIRERVTDELDGDPTGLIRVNPRITPLTADENLLYRQCWPGNRADDDPFGLAPVVVLDMGFDARAVLRLALSLDKAGAVVRRLAPNSPVPYWFGTHTVLVGRPRTRSRVLSEYPRFPEAQIITEPSLPGDDRRRRVLLHSINHALPGPQRLRFDEFPRDLSTPVWAPDIFTAGVYQTREAAFLAGTSRSSLYYLRKQDLLTPRWSDPVRWAFRDLVAVRTWSYLKSKSLKRVSAHVVPALSQFAGRAEAVRLGVTSAGTVLVDRSGGGAWENVETGQKTLGLEITDIDDVFQPFSFGGREVVPLLHTSQNTRLHPAVLHGTPHLKGHRISATSLAALDRRHGREAILSAYPELADVAFDDTVEIGHRLLSAS